MKKIKRKSAVRRISKLTKVSKRAKTGSVNREAVKRKREALGLTLDAAAELAGFKSLIQWWDIENKPERDPRLSTAAKVAKVLKCKVDDLLKS